MATAFTVRMDARSKPAMEALRDNDLPVLASCGGTASCATCHVFLDKEVFDTLGERSEDELELLVEA